MTTREIEATVRERGGGVVIDLRGEINARAEAALDAAYEEAAASDPCSILLNFEETDYINSTGIALIVGILARARADGRKLSACGLSAHYREIFEITRLADYMTLYPDEESAAGSEAK